MLHRLIRHSCTYATCMSPTLNGSFALQCFELSNAFERHTQFLITEASEGLNKAQAILKKKLPALQSSIQICSKAAPQMQPHTLWAKGLQMTVSYMYIFTIHVQHLHYISLCGSRSAVHLFITQVTKPELCNRPSLHCLILQAPLFHPLLPLSCWL